MDDVEWGVTDLRGREPPVTDAGETDESASGVVPLHQDGALRGPSFSATSLRPADAPADGHQLPSRRRLLGCAATLVALLAALAVTVTETLGTRLFPPAASLTPLPIGAGAFIEWGGVPWGTLLVNGRPAQIDAYALEPPSARGQLIPAFHLPVGQYTLEYRAAPFPTLRCRVSVPASWSDTCPLVRSDPAAGISATGSGRLVDLRAQPANLAAGQRAALFAAVRSALNAGPGSTLPATLSPGDHYLADGAIATTASQPLLASLTYDINQDPAQGGGVDTSGELIPCRSLCPFSVTAPPPANAAPGEWVLNAHAVWRWQYTTPDRQIIGAYTPPPAQRGPDALLPVGVQWHAEWQVTALDASDSNILCQAAIHAVYTAWPAVASYPRVFMFAPLPLAAADGCVLTVPSSNASGGLAYILYRFGVLLAANDEAAKLPVPLITASAHERALAAQLAQEGNALPLAG